MRPPPSARRVRWTAAAVSMAMAAALVAWAVFAPRAPAAAGGGATGSAPGTPAAAGDREPAVENLIVEVLAERPHDPGAFTQGLVWDRGTLYESTGLEGASTLRRVDPVSGEVQQRLDLPPDVFAEGLALVPDAGRASARLIQLSWREGEARIWDRDSFERRGAFRYPGEGWGLCYDGRRLVMSDGTETLTFRDPDTFEATGRVEVTLRGQPLAGLNELECVDGTVWANLFPTPTIVRLDPESGRVTAVVDASPLLARAASGYEEVLNGIAFDPDSETFLLTGKLWSKLFEVRFRPKPTRRDKE